MSLADISTMQWVGGMVLTLALALAGYLLQQLAQLRTDLRTMNTELRTDLRTMNTELRTDLRTMNTELRTDIQGLDFRVRTMEQLLGRTLA